jgi:hypothetical protein
LGGHSQNAKARLSYHLILGPLILRMRDLPYTKNTNDFFSKCFINANNFTLLRNISFNIDDTIWDSHENGFTKSFFLIKGNILYRYEEGDFVSFNFVILKILQFPQSFPEN